MSTALSDINKAWQSVAELKKELERTEKKLQKAAKISFRSISSTSILREANPVSYAYFKPDFITKDEINRSPHERLQLNNRSHANAEIKRTRKVSRKDAFQTVKERIKSSALPSKDFSWKQNQITHSEVDSYKLPKHLLQDDYKPALKKNDIEERDTSEYSRIVLLHAAADDTAIHYVNDYIPSAVNLRKENHSANRIEVGFKRPSLKGLQQIREVVERQKQQLQIASLKNDDEERTNIDISKLKENLMKLPENISKEAKVPVNNDSTPVTSSLLPNDSTDNVPLLRKTTTATLPPQYRGFAHAGDKHVRWKVDKQDSGQTMLQQKQKMKRLKTVVDTSDKREFITPSCWRDAQELIKRTIGPAPVVPSHHTAQPSTKSDTDKMPSDLFNDKTGASISSSINDEIPVKDTSIKKIDDPDSKQTPKVLEEDDIHTEETEKGVNDEIPVKDTSIKKIDDPYSKQTSKVLEEDDIHTEETEKGAIGASNKSPSADPSQKTEKSCKISPMKRRYSKKRKAIKSESEKNTPAAKIRHYDPNVVRKYIDKKKQQRRKNQQEEQKRKQLAEEFKKERLRQLYEFQKQAAVTSQISVKKVRSIDTMNSGRVHKDPEETLFEKVETSSKCDISLTSESTGKTSLTSNTDTVLKNVPSEKITSDTQVDNNENYREMTDNPQNGDREPASEEPTSVSFINDVGANTSRYSNEEGGIIKTGEVGSKEISVPVLDERVTMLKQLAISLQDQIDLETQRINMLLRKPAHQRTPTTIEWSNAFKNIVTPPAPSQSARYEILSEQLHTGQGQENSHPHEHFPGVSNIHLHALEMLKMQARVQAAIKIQTVYRGFRARKLYKEIKEKSLNLEKLEKSISENPLLSDNDMTASSEGSNFLTKLKSLGGCDDVNLPGSDTGNKKSTDLSEEKNDAMTKPKMPSATSHIRKEPETLSSSTPDEKLIPDAQFSSPIVDMPDYSSDFVASADEGASTSEQDLLSEAALSDGSNSYSSTNTSFRSSFNLSSTKSTKQKYESTSSAESHTSQSHYSGKSSIVEQVPVEQIHSGIIQEEVSGDAGTLSEGTLSSFSSGLISSDPLPEFVQSEVSNAGKTIGKTSVIHSGEDGKSVYTSPAESVPLSISTSKLVDTLEAVADSLPNVTNDESNKEESSQVSDSSSKTSGTLRTPSIVRTALSVSNHLSVDTDSDSSTIKENAEEKQLTTDIEKTSGSFRELDHVSKTSSSSQDETSEGQITVQSSAYQGTSEINDGQLPSVLGMCMSAELSRLDTVNNSLLYLTEFGHLNALVNHERGTLTLAHMLQMQEERRQQQQENMMQQILQQQESHARILEKTRNEQRKLLQDIITEAHATITEKTLKVVEVQAEAVKSSADALLGLAESHQKAQRDATPNYSKDFEELSDTRRVSSTSRDNLSVERAESVISHSSSSVPEQVELASNQTNTNFQESKESKSSHHDSGSFGRSEEIRSTKQTKSSRESTDESLPESVHTESNISEDHQKSSQKSISEVSSVESPPASEAFIDKSVQVSSVPAHRNIAHILSKHRPHPVVSDQESVSSLEQISLSTEGQNSEGLQSLISNDSFTKFTIDMYHRLAQEEQLRARHQLARLQLQEKELMSKAKAELSCLELLKKKLKQNGSHEKVSSVRKKQRALLLQLHQERAQLRWLQETYYSSLHKGKCKEKKKQHEIRDFQSLPSSSQPQHMKSQKLDIKSSKSSSQPSSSTDIISSENDAEIAVDSDGHSNSPVPSEVPSVGSDSQSKTPKEITTEAPSMPVPEDTVDTATPKHDKSPTIESLLKGLKRLEASKRYLTKREQKLLQRRKYVENLLEWQQKLNDEEAELHGIEQRLLVTEKDRRQRNDSVTSLKSNIIKTSVENERTSNIEYAYSSTSVPQTDVEVSPSSSIENQGISQKIRSGSSVQEELVSLKTEGHTVNGSIPEEILSQHRKSSSQEEVLSLKTEEQGDSGSIQEVLTDQKKRLSETDLYSESFEPSDHGNSSAQPNTESTKKSGGISKKNQNVAIRFPLIPRTHRRHDSSGSEDSFTISQSETASDQSDIEGRIQALNDELKKRQAEAEKLKKENKRRYREQLKERETSLRKQIEAYDQYIQKAKKELEQHLENSGSLNSSVDSSPVKPQIKQPCVAESRRLRRSFTSSGDSSPPSEALKASSSHKASETGNITSPETDNDKEQSLSQASTITSSAGKTSLSQTADENATSKHVGGGDAFSTSASIAVTDITPARDISAFSNERKSGIQAEAKSEISDKSGATQSEAKQTVIEDVVPSIQENDDTEIEIEISEDSAGSESVLKSSERGDVDNSEIVTSQQEYKVELEAEEVHTDVIPPSPEENKVSTERNKVVDRLTDSIFDLLCNDTFTSLKPTSAKEILAESLHKEATLTTVDNSSDTVDEVATINNIEKQEISSEVFSEKLTGDLIKDSLDCVLSIVNKQNILYQSTSSISDKNEQQISDTSKKVSTILATLNDKKLAKDKLRPQDLMVLSPMLDTIDDSNWEITTDLDVDANDVNGISLDSSAGITQKQDFFYESEWFDDDDFGLGQKDGQQSTQEFLQYYREIPNKPPPPYTPPVPKFEEKKAELFSVVAHTPEEIQSVITEAVTTIFEGIQKNIPLADIKAPFDYADEEQDVSLRSQKYYKHFLFDLTKEIACEMYSETKEETPPWIKAWKLNRKSPFPNDCDKLTATVAQKILELLGMQESIISSVGQKKQASLMKLGRKKRDFVDNILIQELREEEYLWVNYEQDEIFIKYEIADYIFDTLIEDTVRIIRELQRKSMVLK